MKLPFYPLSTSLESFPRSFRIFLLAVRYLLFLFPLEGTIVASHAQTPTYLFAKAIGGIGRDYGNSIKTDASGNSYVTGNFQGTVDFDPSAGVANLTSTGGDDIFLAKYDASGNYVWAKAIGGIYYDYSTSLALDGSGNVFVTGYFSGIADFDPSSGVANLTAVTGTYDVFVAKYNESGNYLWAIPLGGNSSDQGTSLAVDKSGNVLVTGIFQGTIDFDPSAGMANLISSVSFDDIFIAKYDASGNYVWAKVVGGIYSDYSTSLVLDGNDNICVTGFFGGEADFDPSVGTANLTSLGQSDIFIAKYDPSGNYLWAKALSGIYFEMGTSLGFDKGGNVLVTGQFEGTVDFDPSIGVANLTSTSASQDIFVAKYDASGSYLWSKAIGGSGIDRGLSLGVDKSENVLITGTFQSTVDFDPSDGVANRSAAENSNGFFLAKYNTSGSYVWVSTTGGSSLTLDDSGNILLTGSFQGTVDFDPSSGVANRTAIGESSIFVAKYGTCQALTNQPSAIAPVCSGVDVSIPISATGTGLTYQWYKDGLTLPGQTLSSLLLSNVTSASTGSYSVAVKSIGACVDVISPPFNLTVNAPPTITVTPNPSFTILSGTQATFTASGADSFSWSTGEITAAISVSMAATYTVRGIDTNGCSATAAATLALSSGPDLCPTLVIPNGIFPINASRNFVVNVYETGYLPTTTGSVIITVTVPTGYSLSFDQSLTSIGLSDGSTTSVSNRLWGIRNAIGTMQLSLVMGAGESIAAGGMSVVGLTITRTTANSGSTSNMTVNVANDASHGYDVNNTNNVYARTIAGL